MQAAGHPLVPPEQIGCFWVPAWFGFASCMFDTPLQIVGCKICIVHQLQCLFAIGGAVWCPMADVLLRQAFPLERSAQVALDGFSCVTLEGENFEIQDQWQQLQLPRLRSNN